MCNGQSEVGRGEMSKITKTIQFALFEIKQTAHLYDFVLSFVS